MSELPKQIRDQAANVEAIEARLQEERSPAPANPPADQPKEPDTPPAPQPPAPAPTPPAPEPEKDWEHRYRTLQGMIRSQNDQFTAQIREKDGQIEALQNQVKQLLEAAKAPPEQPKPAPVSQEDIDKFGPEIVDFVSRQAKQMAEQLMAPVKQELDGKNAEIAELKKQIGGVAENQGHSRRAEYERDLTGLVANWRTVNVDPAFGAWLAEVEPVAGVTRQDLLTDAYNKFDVARTAYLFNSYLGQAPQPPTPPAPAPSRPSLESQAAPGKSKVDAPPASDKAGKIWSRAEIDAAYVAARRGDYSAADWARIETEIDTATAEGRVR